MARLLVRLKLRLLTNTLSRGLVPALGFGLAVLAGLGFATAGFLLIAAAGTAAAWGDIVTLVFAGLWLAWLVLPVLTFTSDETLDPRRFALLPVRPRDLVPGLLLAALVGVGPVASGIAASGAVWGTHLAGGSSVGLLLTAMAVLALLVCCLTSSRALTTSASNLLASRRGRDLAALAAALLAVGVYVVFQGIAQLSTTEVVWDLEGPATIARLLPGGLAGAAVAWASDGAYGLALLAIGGVLLWTMLAIAIWGRAMDRVDRRQPARSGSTSRSGAGELYPALLRWLPRTRTTAVAMRFLRGLARDSRVRTQALQQIFVLLPMLMVSLTSGALTSGFAPLLAALFVVPVGMVATNQLGLDGPALWLHELAGARPVADILGRNLALGVVAAPTVPVAAVALAVWSGGWAYVPAALLLGVALFGLVLAPANVGSVLLPIPVPEPTNNLFGARQSGQGCVNGFLSIGILFAQGVLILPLLIALLLVDGVVGRTAVAGIGVVYAGAVLAAGVRLAAGRLRRSGPELLLAVDPG